MKTIYVSIGNSDDKLSQRQWAAFCLTTGMAISERAETVHGAWFSDMVSPYQNACWCFEIKIEDEEPLRDRLKDIGLAYQQDSIAYATATTEFLK